MAEIEVRREANSGIAHTQDDVAGVGEDGGHFEWMDEVRLTRVPHLSLVLERREHVGSPKQFDVPRALSDSIMKALSKAREARWQSAREMRQALLPFAVIR